jgi:hypothetical protein
VGTAQTTSERRSQFTIRTALLAMLVLAMAFVWYKSAVVTERKNDGLMQRLYRAHSEIRNAKSRAEFDQRAKGSMSGRRGLSNVRLDGMNLRGISINGALFQVSSFKNCDLHSLERTP